MPTDPKKKAQTKAKSQAKKQVKKAAKKNPGIVIALVAIVVVIVVVAVVLYLKVPAVNQAVNNIIHPESASVDNGTNNSGNNGNANSNLVLGEGELKVHFIDVGQGDCIFIQFPDGKDMLIDCGNETKTSLPSETLTYLQTINTDNDIDYLMLTHTDKDHVSFLDEIIDAFDIFNIYMPNIKAVPGTDSTQKAALQDKINKLDSEKLALFTDPDTVNTIVYAEFFWRALSEPQCTIHLNVDDDDKTNSIIIKDDANTYSLIFYCMTAEQWASTNLGDAYKVNAVSPIGILEYNGKRIVLTGDSNKNNEPNVAKRIGHIDCDVLKVAHHGSDTSSLEVFIDAVTCEYAVFCCGTGNKYGHPTQVAINSVLKYCTTIYRTDLNGTIVLTVNGEGTINFTMDDNTPTQEQERVGAK